jgi:hypothetical protein
MTVLWNDDWRTQPLLGNDSINTHPRQRTCAQQWKGLLGKMSSMPDQSKSQHFMHSAFGGGAMSWVNSCKTYIYMWFCSQRRISNPKRGFSFRIITLIGPTASREETAFPIPCKPMLYVRYVRLTKAKPIHKRNPHRLVREVLHKDQVQLQRNLWSWASRGLAPRTDWQ